MPDQRSTLDQLEDLIPGGTEEVQPLTKDQLQGHIQRANRQGKYDAADYLSLILRNK